MTGRKVLHQSLRYHPHEHEDMVRVHFALNGIAINPGFTMQVLIAIASFQ